MTQKSKAGGGRTSGSSNKHKAVRSLVKKDKLDEEKLEASDTNNNSEEQQFTEQNEVTYSNSSEESALDAAEQNSGGDSGKKVFKKLSEKASTEPSANSNSEIIDDIARELEESAPADNQNNYNPLKPPVKKRGYTAAEAPRVNGQQQPTIETPIAEPVYTGSNSAMPEVDEKLLNPNANNGSANANANNSSSASSNATSNSNSSSGSLGTTFNAKVEEPPKNTAGLSGTQRKEAIEKTADGILLAYQQYFPALLHSFARFNTNKLNKLHKNGEIDLKMEMKDGQTVRDYILDFNKGVEEKIKVEQSEVDGIRKPLIDVLSEQDIAMTPIQRLMVAAAPPVLAKIGLGIQFYMAKQEDMEDMKDLQKNRTEAINRQAKAQEKENQMMAEYIRLKKKEEEEKRAKESEINPNQPEEKVSSPSENTSKSNVTDAIILSETKKTEEASPTLDSALEIESQTTITQEEQDVP